MLHYYISEGLYSQCILTWFQILKPNTNSYGKYLIETNRILLTIRHTTRQIYWCIAQYSSTHHIITKVRHLLQLSNNNHKAEPRTDERLNGGATADILLHIIQNSRVNILAYKRLNV